MNPATMQQFARAAAVSLDSEQREYLEKAGDRHSNLLIYPDDEYGMEICGALRDLRLVTFAGILVKPTDLGLRILDEIEDARNEAMNLEYERDSRREG